MPVVADDDTVFCLRQNTERPYEIARLDLEGSPSSGAAVTDVR